MCKVGYNRCSFGEATETTTLINIHQQTELLSDDGDGGKFGGQRPQIDGPFYTPFAAHSIFFIQIYLERTALTETLISFFVNPGGKHHCSILCPLCISTVPKRDLIEKG